MRKIGLLVFTAAVLGIASAASAADMGAAAPIYSKAPAPAPVWSWSGSYIGGFVGGASGASDFTNTNPFAVTPPASYKLGSTFIGGYTSGYNWQLSPSWLLGYEGETGYIHVKTQGVFPTAAPAFGETQVGNFYNVWAARLGYVTGSSLIYAKGGAVLTRFDTGVFTGGAAGGFTNHNYALGYAVGGGWEYALDTKWSIKAEYLYLGFDKDFTYSGLTPVVASTTHFSGLHTGKVGLNYKWDWFNFLR